MNKKLKRFERQYDKELESAGLMSGRKLKTLIATNPEVQRIISDMIQPKGGTAVKDDLRNGTGTNK